MEDKEKDSIIYILKVLKNPELTLTDNFKEWSCIDNNRELYWDMRAAFDGLSAEEKIIPDINEQWDHLQNSIRQIQFCKTNGKKKKFMISSFRWAIAASAACIIVAFGFYFYLKPSYPINFMRALAFPQEVILNKNGEKIVLKSTKDLASHYAKVTNKVTYNTIATPRGKDFTITLSDGTQVMLNAESSLRYPTTFTGSNRSVELKGEAFFTVAKDCKHPFIVHTTNTTTIVTGTKFNFRAYDNSAPHVTLIEGSVSVKSNDSRQELKLKPGEDASFSNSGELTKKEIDVSLFTAWTEGFFYFEEASLSDIMQELGRWYNVNIYFSNEDLMNYHFNFWVNRHQSVQKALILLNEMGKVNATFKNNTIYIK